MENGVLAPWVLRIWNTADSSEPWLKTEDSVRCPSCGSANMVVTIGPTEPTEPTRQVAESYLGMASSISCPARIDVPVAVKQSSYFGSMVFGIER